MYNIPDILNRSLEVLKMVVDNVDEVGLLNILNCKMAQLVSVKGSLFRQFSNGNPRTLSYYSMNFLSSGSRKDFALDTINDQFLGFLEAELEQRLENFKKQYKINNPDLKEKDLLEELESLRTPNIELGNATYAGLYRESEQIARIGFGSIFIRIGEFGDLLENLSTAGADKSKKELYQKMKEIFEGTIMPSVIAGDSKRKTLKNIPVQIALYSDFENLLDVKVKDYFISTLKTGMARRSFIFIPKDDKILLQYPRKIEEKENAYLQARELKKQYRDIFDHIQDNTIYDLSEEAKEMLYNYQCDCIDYFNNSKEEQIVKIEKRESFWKITKLAVIYSIIDNPTSKLVASKYVKMAIDFYELISPCLKRVLEKRKKNEIELYANYLADHAENIVTRTELRQANFVNGNKFKQFFETHIDEIKEELQEQYGYELYDFSGKGNVKAFQLVRSQK